MNETTTFDCERCQRQFGTAKDLNTHNRTVHNPDRPKFKATEEQLEKQRLAQAARRAAFIKLGLTGTGTKRKRRGRGLIRRRPQQRANGKAPQAMSIVSPSASNLIVIIDCPYCHRRIVSQ